MGGEVGVASEPGQGSTFWLTVRLGRPGAMVVAEVKHEQDSPTEAPATSPDFSAYRLLLVDDDPINLEVAQELLTQMQGLRVETAGDGAQALQMAALNAYDLILMDMQMPVMDGLTATRAIRKLPAYATTPILAITANAFAEDRQRCLDAGMNDYIAKPFTQNAMFGSLVKWMKGRV
jgi:CheY-like chemotaxis protein